ncbi:MAG TPA: PaaI family thioesterase [Thermoanaerobaculia bacterium]|jgi:acyl-coenzyme A thioesterase PaaI-like protein|nr:PaaI family thioesterase [Thermoanaerobaculia bacterium]
MPTSPSRTLPPPVAAASGWQPLDPFRLEGGRGSFVSGDPQGDTLRVAYFRRVADGRLVGRAWFGPGSAGPPGHAHGGSMAAVLDEAMGAAAWMAGHIAVAAHLATDFRAMLPLGTDALLEAWVERRDERKVWTAGTLRGDDGTLFAEGEALFIRLDAERDRALLARAAEAMGRKLEDVLAAVRASAGR